MKKISFSIITIFLLVSLFSINVIASNFEEDTIRVGIGFNDQTAQYKALEVFKSIVEQKTDSTVEVELYHSSQLGDDREMMEALRMGTQEMTCPASAPVVGFAEEFKVLDLPYLFPSREIMEEILDGEEGDYLFEQLKKSGLHGLAYWDEGFRNITNSVRKIKSPEDLNGLKIRTMENPIHMQAFREWGASPTPMPFGEVFSALEQGVVDGQENPSSVVYLSNFYEVQEYYTHSQHFAAPYILIISQQYWESISPELKEVIDYATEVATAYHRKLSRDFNNKYFEKLKEVMDVTTLSTDQKLEFREAASGLYVDLEKEIGEKPINMFLNAVEEELQ